MTIGSENYRESITKSNTHLKSQKSILRGEDNAKAILSPILERKLETITSGLRQASLTGLQTISYNNSSTIADYILVGYCLKSYILDHMNQYRNIQIETKLHTFIVKISRLRPMNFSMIILSLDSSSIILVNLLFNLFRSLTLFSILSNSPKHSTFTSDPVTVSLTSSF